MAATASYQQYHSFSSALSYNPSSTIITAPVGSTRTKLPTFTSIRSLSNEERASSKSSRQHALRSTLRSIDTKMSASVTAIPTTTTTNALPLAAAKRAEAQQTRLHKRAKSSSSLNSSPAVSYSHFTTPFATYEEEPFPNILPTPVASTPKIKPYLRKLSTTGKEDPDQGRLNLDKSVSENSALAGLGIADFATRTDSLHSGRTTPHARNTSVGSTGSGSYRPTLPFIHPMRQMPNRPYTPATDASSIHDEDPSDSTDLITSEDFPAALSLRMARSASISSTPAIPTPPPLSRTQTASDFDQVPKLTSTSQSNLSIHSSRSRPSRPRGDTNYSLDRKSTPSSRTSLDKTFSFVSRRSDVGAVDDATTRDERIQAARRKFDEKEANKTRKAEEEELKRLQIEHAKTVKKQERQRRQSAASSVGADRPRIPKMLSTRSLRSNQREEGLRALRYDQSKPTALPRQGTEPGRSEKSGERAFGMGGGTENEKSGGWNRFSTWVQMRVLRCGGKKA